MNQENYLAIAIDIAQTAGAILTKNWGNITSIQQKQAFWDLVTNVDLAAEAHILGQLQHYFPTHEVLSEESGLHKQTNKNYLWVIDPLDGTTNYTHQYPMVCVSIGLFIDNAPYLGVIFNPILKELFFAEKGKGAFLNGHKIQVSSVTELNQSLLATGFAYDRKKTTENNYMEFCGITHCSQGVRRGGSAALDLAYVATGRLDGYWERGLKPWDMAAGILLVEEAGGLVTSYDSTPFDLYSGRILATNRHIHRPLSEALESWKNYKFPIEL